MTRATWSLYLGAIITALAVPSALDNAGLSRDGLGTFCLGIAFLSIALVRATGGGGVGWQALIGGLLALVGAVNLIQPQVGGFIVPIVWWCGGPSWSSASMMAPTGDVADPSVGREGCVRTIDRRGAAGDPRPSHRWSQEVGAMRPPPIGVAVLGFFALVNGSGLTSSSGLRLMGIVTFGPAETGIGPLLLGCSSLRPWAALHRGGLGRVDLRVWAWTFGMLMAILGIFNAVMVRSRPATWRLVSGSALLPAVMLWYLNTEGVKDAFVEGEIEAGRGFANDYEREVAQRMAAERADDSMG